MDDSKTTEHDIDAETTHERPPAFDARDVVHEGDHARVRELLDAAQAGKLTEEDTQEQQDSLEWLLAAFDGSDEDREVHHTMRLNVGGIGPANERWIKWTVKNVDGGLLRKLREGTMGGGRRGANVDLDAVFGANVQIVLAGTVYPPLRQAAAQRGIADPGAIIEEAFKTKPGRVEAIAGTIMDLSGYDPDAARDEREVAAAGNS